ncbi:MAG: hypothetical protein LBD04_02000 [Synergistaceae bacterium]|jgi:hypothetical protein|nr:hypothetical protein [Synergistaceae bacterium]
MAEKAISEKEVYEVIKSYTYLWPKTKLGQVLAWVILFSFLMVYPGLYVFNRAEPFVLGMPFSFVWLTFWAHVIIVCGVIAAKKF